MHLYYRLGCLSILRYSQSIKKKRTILWLNYHRKDMRGAIQQGIVSILRIWMQIFKFGVIYFCRAKSYQSLKMLKLNAHDKL